MKVSSSNYSYKYCLRSFVMMFCVTGAVVLMSFGFGGYVKIQQLQSGYSHVFRESTPVCREHVDLQTVLKLSQNSHLAEVPSCQLPPSRNTSAPEGGVAKVIFLAYQRSGSSFLGEILAVNPNAFYMFEPIDGVYSSLYGTGFGWNVPDHIMSDENGNSRNHSSEEIESVGRTVASILNCDFSNTPIQVLAHRFQLGRNSITPYKQCLQKNNVIDISKSCRSYLNNLCKGSFYPGPAVQFCYSGINGKLDETMPEVLKAKKTHGMSFKDIEDSFKDYRRCFEHVQKKSSNCVHVLESICKSKSIRGLKTVRIGMEMAVQILRYIPDLKIVHNVRDPRAITLSRKSMNIGDMMAYSSHNDIVKEAKILCNTIGRHIKIRRALEKLRPGTSIQNTYEDFAKHPLERAERLYKFLGYALPNEVRNWLELHSSGKKDGKIQGKNSSAIALAWEDKISLYKTKQIDQYCRRFYDDGLFGTNINA